MKKIFLQFMIISFLLNFATAFAYQNKLPSGFVYLKDIAPSIQQDIRYSTYHNFIGRPVKGYAAAECILSKPTALALKKVQNELLQSGLSLKVYDCYRPQMAVNDFIAWSQQPKDQLMKAEFYPRVNKKDFFKLGYVAAKSGHSRGSTVDLTIIPSNSSQQQTHQSMHKLVDCTAAYSKRFQDGSIDMGTNFDCMDELSHNDSTKINLIAYQQRLLLIKLMEKYGFTAYEPEWWHFTLTNEPYPNTYFNFPITNPSST